MLANIEGEAALVGALLLDNARVDSVADLLKPEHFGEPVMGRIFEAIVHEVSLGRSASPITLGPILSDDPGIQALNGPGYLFQLTGSGAVSFLNCADQARQIIEFSARRKLVAALAEISGDVGNHEKSLVELVAAADAAIFEATGKRDSFHQPTAAQCVEEAMAEFNRPIRGVFSGTLSRFDRALGPMRPSHLVIGAGRPGMGKTAFAISYSIGAAARGHGVLFVSLEMGSTELGQRMAADMCCTDKSGVPFEAIVSGEVSVDQAREVARARAQLVDMPFHVVDAAGMTVGRLSMIVRRYKRRLEAKGKSLDLVVVDYLQLLRPDRRGNSNYENVSEVSRTLKEIAKQHDVAVFALAQLSRDVEKREDKRPQLSDLRDSGQLEQDADAVVFFYRPEYYLSQIEPRPETQHGVETAKHAEWRETFEQVQGKMDLIIAKKRNGRKATAHAIFHAAFQAVRDDSSAGEAR